jgi:hypothetical protein
VLREPNMFKYESYAVGRVSSFGLWHTLTCNWSANLDPEVPCHETTYKNRQHDTNDGVTYRIRETDRLQPYTYTCRESP